MPKLKLILRAAGVLLLFWLLNPFIFGGGWALVNIGYLGYQGVKKPVDMKALNSMEKTEQIKYTQSLVAQGAKPSAILLSLIAFALMGSLYGLVARYWQSTFLIFLVTLTGSNPVFFKIPFSLVERILVILFCQLLVSYGFSYLFSRIGIISKKLPNNTLQPTPHTPRRG